MAVVERRPGTKQGMVSRMFDGESAPAAKPVVPKTPASKQVRKKTAKAKNKTAKQPRAKGRKKEKT